MRGIRVGYVQMTRREGGVVETSKPTLSFLEETVGVFADYF